MVKLSEFVATKELMEVVEEAALGEIQPIDDATTNTKRWLYELSGWNRDLAFVAACRAYAECLAYAAQLKQERDRGQLACEQFEKVLAEMTARADALQARIDQMEDDAHDAAWEKDTRS